MLWALLISVFCVSAVNHSRLFRCKGFSAACCSKSNEIFLPRLTVRVSLRSFADKFRYVLTFPAFHPCWWHFQCVSAPVPLFPSLSLPSLSHCCWQNSFCNFAGTLQCARAAVVLAGDFILTRLQKLHSTLLSFRLNLAQASGMRLQPPTHTLPAPCRPPLGHAHFAAIPLSLTLRLCRCRCLCLLLSVCLV